jgi:hypothetical protein
MGSPQSAAASHLRVVPETTGTGAEKQGPRADVSTRFKPGQSGNPKGVRRDRDIRSRLSKRLRASTTFRAKRRASAMRPRLSLPMQRRRVSVIASPLTALRTERHRWRPTPTENHRFWGGHKFGCLLLSQFRQSRLGHLPTTPSRCLPGCKVPAGARAQSRRRSFSRCTGNCAMSSAGRSSTGWRSEGSCAGS